MQQLKTADEIRADFDRRGINVAQWAREHGVTKQTVFALLHGKAKGKRGEAHKAAVLLGLKNGVIESQP